MKKLFCILVVAAISASFIHRLSANEIFEERLSSLLNTDMNSESINSCKNLLIQVKAIATILLFCGTYYHLNDDYIRTQPIFLDSFGHPYLRFMLDVINNVDDILCRRKCDMLPINNVLSDIGEMILSCNSMMVQILSNFQNAQSWIEFLDSLYSILKDLLRNNLNWSDLQSSFNQLLKQAIPTIFEFTKKYACIMGEEQQSNQLRRKNISCDMVRRFMTEDLPSQFTHFKLTVFEGLLDYLASSDSDSDFWSCYQECIKIYAQDFVTNQLA